MAEKVIGVLASGRGSNFQAIIDTVKSGSLPVKIGVLVCDKRDAYAIERSKTAGIPFVIVERKEFSSKDDFENQINEELKKYDVELVVLAGFMRLLGKTFIRSWQNSIMNIHPSLLPSFPGLHPQLQAIEYGAKVSGCTVHFVDEGMDSGPVILQKAVEVFSDDTEDTLAERILKEEHKLYPDAIRLWAEDRLRMEGRLVVKRGNDDGN